MTKILLNPAQSSCILAALKRVKKSLAILKLLGISKLNLWRQIERNLAPHAELDHAWQLQPLCGLSPAAVGRGVAGDDPRGHRRPRAQRHRPRIALGRCNLVVYVRVRNNVQCLWPIVALCKAVLSRTTCTVTISCNFTSITVHLIRSKSAETIKLSSSHIIQLIQGGPSAQIDGLG